MDVEKNNFINKTQYNFDDLVGVMETLLAPDGCPWDRAQTHESLKRYLIEEAYEVLEAIDAGDSELLCEELGDVLLQIVFHANIAAQFGIGDVINAVCKKMITRHPHVFGDVVATTPDEVVTNWEGIKRKEKGTTGHAQVLKHVPANLPALMRAYKVQQKARDAGFDWDGIGPVLDKVEEELAELRRAIAASEAGRGEVDKGGGAAGGASDSDATAVEDELGDLLFATVNLSRFAKIHPELALTASTEKFIRRFTAMEDIITGEGRALAGMTLAEMDVYWDKVKSTETKC